ncbi:hypothetical protein [Saccharopolyspora thermophila]|nr:hypothetical protein [Saccharopolyspora subtropica]
MTEVPAHSGGAPDRSLAGGFVQPWGLPSPTAARRDQRLRATSRKP